MDPPPKRRSHLCLLLLYLLSMPTRGRSTSVDSPVGFLRLGVKRYLAAFHMNNNANTFPRKLLYS